MNDVPELLLDHHLKTLKLPTFLSQYAKLARQCAAENVEHVGYLKRLTELELIERERRMIERRLVWPRSDKHRAGSRPQSSRQPRAWTAPTLWRSRLSTSLWSWNWRARNILSGGKTLSLWGRASLLHNAHLSMLLKFKSFLQRIC
jgi:hypothetical protein